MRLKCIASATYRLKLMMYAFLIFSLSMLAACHLGSADKSQMKITKKEVMKVGNQLRHYLIVTGFDGNSKECWQSLEAFAESAEAPAGLLTGNHLLIFVDNKDFLVSESGDFTDSQAIHVIAQHIFNSEEGYNTFMVSPTYLLKQNY